jgi:O-antigen ligase
MAPTPETLRRWGNGLLWGGLGIGLLGTFVLAWAKPDLLPLLPVLLAGGLAFAVLVRYPLLHLCVVLGGFVTIFNYDEGIQASEVLFGLYYLSYLVLWFACRLVVRRERLLQHPIDYLVAFFLVYATATLVLNPVFGGSLFKGVNEWRAFMVLAFYFPVRDAARDPQALRALLFTFVFVALFIALRNFMQYFLALQDVGALWEVVQNRERVNERLVMIALVGSLVFFLYWARTWWMYAFLFFLSAVFTASIMVGRSRTVWLALVLALAVVFVLSNRRDRVRLLLFGATGFVTVLVVGVLLFDDLFVLVLSGLADRFASIGDANEVDISMINRFHEWRTVWGHVLESPFLGHGYGVPYHNYNLIYGVTEHKTFVHNTYLGTLYRHGFVGLALVLTILAGSFIRGVRLVRMQLGRLVHATALTASASLVALALAALTEDVLLATDGVYAVTVPLALLMGLKAQTSLSPATTVSE